MEHSLTSKKSSIQRWVLLYSDDLFRWALHKTSNRETAEDLVQDTFLAALKSFDSFQEKSKPKSWLFSIMNNKITDYYRKKSRTKVIHQSQLNKSENPDILGHFFENNGSWKAKTAPAHWSELEGHLLDNPDFKPVFDFCLNTLSKKWFSMIKLKYLEGKKANEICQEFGITPSNFWQILHRSKLHLRLCLEKFWFQK